MYDHAQGVTQDIDLAIEWYSKAAMQNHMVAENNLGVIYATGKGVNRDFDEAYKWYLRSAEIRFAVAQVQLRPYVRSWI